MGNFKFSLISKERLEECAPDLQAIIELGLKWSEVDFGINCGHRTPETQYDLYKKGRAHRRIVDRSKVVTNCDGYTKKSKHNFNPSLAVDIVPFIRGTMVWDEVAFLYLGGVMRAASKYLLDYAAPNKKITHGLRWGGNWNGDGEIVKGQKLVDMPHYELIKLK